MNPRVIYVCPFVPAEWIAAHGIQPSRIMLQSPKEQVSVGAGEGVCSFAHSFINASILEQNASAVIVTTLCDQMRRAGEIIERNCELPVFLMNVPHTWESANAQKLYKSEIERLGRFLVSLGGATPSNEALARTMQAFDEMRSSLKSLRRSLPAIEYSRLITKFHQRDFAETGTVPSEARGLSQFPHSIRETVPPTLNPRDLNDLLADHHRRDVHPPGIPLALVGGPLLADHFRLFDVIQDAGGYVALDGTETGERGMPAPFDPRQTYNDPLGTLTDAYFAVIPDASRRPDTMLYQWLEREIGARGIKGVISIRHIWCDAWHAESQRMKEWLDVPFFDLDVSEDSGDFSRGMTRLQAFMEMLQ